jgi:asparagine synthase (glutamine-hydrolysing)
MELALSVPSNIRTKRFDLKYLLRRVVADVLPRELRNARKKGSVLPLPLWLRGKLRPLVIYFLNPEYLKRQGIFQPEVYERYVLPHLEGRADFHHQIWTLLMFQLWHHVFIVENAIDKPSYNWKDIIS